MRRLWSAAKAMFDRDGVVPVPAMDGPYKPNNLLEQAERLFALPDVDNLAVVGTTAYVTSGSGLYRFDAGTSSALAQVRLFEQTLTFLTVDPNGALAVGVESEGVWVGDESGDGRLIPLPPKLTACMTAATFLPDGRLLILVGSTRHRASEWKRDLMERGATGLAVALDLASGAVQEIAAGLAYPNDALVLENGALAVSESWRHRLVAIPATRAILEDLPGYPARMAKASDGGFWLTLFAPRRQLFEQILIEDDFRREMMATIDPSEWIGPDLRLSDAPEQPLQQGSVRQMGQIKPWAPSRAYGLVVRCDSKGAPIRSWHSRADGTLHGITSVVEAGGCLLIASKGAGVVARLSIAGADHD